MNSCVLLYNLNFLLMKEFYSKLKPLLNRWKLRENGRVCFSSVCMSGRRQRKLSGGYPWGMGEREMWR
jgi:hypothetical protein